MSADPESPPVPAAPPVTVTRRAGGRRIGIVVVAVVVVLFSAMALQLSGGDVSADPAPAPKPSEGTVERSRIFAADSVQNASLGPATPLAPDSAQTVEKLVNQVSYTKNSAPVAGFFDPPWSVRLAGFMPLYTVPSDAKRYPVTWVDDKGEPVRIADDHVADQPLAEWLSEGVPMPPGAQPGREPDSSLALWQPETDTYWEFWRMAPVLKDGVVVGWTCRYAGRIENASRSNGVFPHNQGSGATSIAYGDLQLRVADWTNGTIGHALALQLPVTADTFVPPATRNDTHRSVQREDPRDAIAEGTRFRLPATFNPEAYEPGDDHRAVLSRMLLTAVRDHGMYVTDSTGGTVNLVAEPRVAHELKLTENAAKLPSWWGQEGTFFGFDNVMLDFPWDQLQVVEP